MEATCLELVPGLWVRDREGLAGVSATGRVRVSRVCGAPIPRLDEGPCAACGKEEGDGWLHRAFNGHSYLGPLASECTAGHPVAVPSEAERRG
jgi:hypothetical protein